VGNLAPWHSVQGANLSECQCKLLIVLSGCQSAKNLSYGTLTYITPAIPFRVPTPIITCVVPSLFELAGHKSTMSAMPSLFRDRAGAGLLEPR
jgi:hypothetical protein